ncbi:MAG: cell surface protein SprA [Edaphocola sp.]
MANKQHNNFGYKVLGCVAVVMALVQVFTARGFDDPYFDPPPPPNDTPEMRFPLEQNTMSGNDTTAAGMDLNDPANVKKIVEYNPEDSTYTLREQVGGKDIKPPTYLTAEEYMKMKAAQDETDYWKQRLDALSMFNQKPKLPTLYKEGIFDRLFGNNGISVKPQGNMDLTFGGSWQNMKNPNLTQRAQKYGIFDFDMQMNVNLLAQIGDKLKLNISNNTLPSFGEQNTQKLEYTGKEDDIIKKVEAGNVSFPLKSSLLTGPLSLFGIKTQLQFGRLFLTGVLSQQKSQRKTLSLQGGAQTTSFEIKADDYEENRNFLLGQYFFNNYDNALANYPVVNSQVVINKIEVWVTNRTGATTGVRNMINFMDLGEASPYRTNLTDASAGIPNGYPDNRANSLYNQLAQYSQLRKQGTGTIRSLINIGLDSSQGKDYTVATMRQLNTSEYTFQPQLGYIALNTQVNADDVIGVAYRYTVNGKVYQVGEFAEDFPPDGDNTKVMFLKMLKTVSALPRLPIWNLMMKNVYATGGTNLAEDGFRLNVLYQDPGGGEKRYIPEGPSAGIPLIKLLNLDRLNPQNDPAPDGVFDYVEGITVNSQMGKIIFPMLEPFGEGLKPSLGGDATLEKRYLYPMLYDSTKTIARNYQQNNRFVLSGQYKGASGSEVSLGGFNIPQGSVTVTAGGQRLSENVDYTVDYSRGTVKIINQSYLSSSIPITISYEDNATFGIVQQNFWGVRADYYFNDKLTLGTTLMRLTERPYTQKVSYGDDPVKNTVAGFDATYQSEVPAITKMLDKLPIYSTSAPSLISVSGEVAGIFPGHQRFVDALDPEGAAQIDDFEGTNNSIDLRFPATSWFLSSPPVGAKDPNNIALFPEATNTDNLTSNDNRAKLSWYMLEPTLIDGSSGTPDNIQADTGYQDYWRQVQQQEVYPLKSCITGQCGLQTFDLGYYPNTRGPYNFSLDNVNDSGIFTNPKARWGGIQRALDNNSSDFEATNVEYITFWLLDPFLYKTDNAGELYFNLGNVSEDVLKDARMSFENGIPYPKDYSKLDATQWGYVPQFQQQITRAFDNDENARAVQDVGYDELNDDEERTKFANFLSNAPSVITDADALLRLQNDPASDNFHHYRGSDYDQITGRHGEAYLRYINFNSPHGNSPISSATATYTTSGSAYPESEDINKDNSLNETEAYYQYHVKLRPSTDPIMAVGSNFIVDKKTTNVELDNGRTSTQTWYQFKIPIREYDQAVGGIGDFRSIRFMRMFMTGFSDTTIVRFAQLQLDRNQWRRYQLSLTSPGENIPEEDQLTTSYGLTAVSLEQNSDRSPVPYVMPPGLERQVTAGQTGQNLQLDEQSLSLQVCGLKDGDARGAFKAQTLDLRQYKTMRMFVHAESVPGQTALRDGDLVAFIRLGSDVTNNYYEYRIPLQITAAGVGKDASLIWPDANKLEMLLSDLTALKQARNDAGQAAYVTYTGTDSMGNTISVLGNPNFGEIKVIMLGVANPKQTLSTPNDDGQRKCAEVWFDELRIVDPNEQPGYAATGQVNMQLADLGNVNMNASMHTVGYGAIDQKVNERSRDDYYAYGANTTLNMGKLLPKKVGLQLPVYVGYSETVSNPQYDPYDKDILLSDKLARISDDNLRDSAHKAAQTFSSVTAFNLANIRYLGNPEKQGKNMPWSLKNFDASYAYNRTFGRDPTLLKDELVDQKLGLGYNYGLKTKFIEPFKKLIKTKSKWALPVKDFNFNLLPSSFSFRNNLHRMVGETQVRNLEDDDYVIDPTFYKNFVWERTYALRWELSKSLSFNYSANNQSRIDEPEGWIDTKEKKDSMLGALSKLGRNTYFSQTLNATYTVPTQKFPFLDWTRVTLTYASTYNWTAASRLAYTQGNIIANTRNKQINGELTFSQLYNKWRYTKAVNTPKRIGNANQKGGKLGSNKNAMLQGKDAKVAPAGTQNTDTTQAAAVSSRTERQRQREEEREERRRLAQLPPRPEKKDIDKTKIPGADTMSAKALNTAWKAAKKAERKRFKKELAAWRAKRRNTMPFMSDGAIAVGRLVTMVKRVSLNYAETGGTTLPGFMDSTRFLGVNNRSNNPWYDFAFGNQPSQAWFDRQAALQRISQDSLFNGLLQQAYSQNLNIQATLEPVPDLRINLTWTKQFSKSYSETFKYDGSDYAHYTPYSLGTFNITYIGLKTIFKSSKANQLSGTYEEFMANRTTVSRRLGSINPYTAGADDPDDPAYAKGYTQYSQDVLIPSFLAAYTGRDARTIPLVQTANENIKSNPFKYYFPLPNWSLTYNGLSKMASLADYVNNVNISHTYAGTLSMNSFASNLYYQDILATGYPSFIDSNSHNYIPYFQVPNITMTETLGPFLGIETAFKNGMNLSVKFNKSRTVSLSLTDYQVSETKSSELVVGGGARIKGFVLPFPVFGVTKLKNDLNVNVSVGYRDDITSNTYLAQNTNIPTRGQKVITISPTIDYIVNDYLQLRFYFDRRQSIPVLSTSYPITTTRGGVTLRFLFAPQ